MFKRGFFYIATMFAVMVVFGIVCNIVFAVCGVEMDQASFTSILGISAIMGFSGSFISIFMSKMLVKKQMNVRVITGNGSANEKWLVDTVAKLAKAKGVGMPEVGIYDAPEMNAFATGWNRNSALVAVSSGLLSSMSQDEIEAVLGHEMSHVSNGDMVTMGLIQGVMNTFVYALSYVVAAAIASKMNSGNNSKNSIAGTTTYYLISQLMQLIFGFLAQFVVMYFSRVREYHADAGSAEVCGAQNMINALLALENGAKSATSRSSSRRKASANMNSLFITLPADVTELLSSHPTIEKRVAELRAKFLNK